MDERTFDRWAVAVAQRPTRRAALRLVAGALLGGLLSWRRVGPARAQDACGGCPPGHVCRGGVCLVPHSSFCMLQGLTECGGNCVDIDEDARNCGACGVVCRSNESCARGRCFSFDDLNCAAQGLTNCGGACVNLASDSGHCGDCGTSCPIGSFCQGGDCASSGYFCTTQGLTECDGRCVDVWSDVKHCGGCNEACYVSGARCVRAVCI